MSACLRLAALAAALALGGCAHAPSFPASGSIADQEVRTAVDSRAAQVYLEQRSRQALSRTNERLAQTLERANARPLTNALLHELTQEFSVDLATLYLLERLYRDDYNRRLQNAFHDALAELRGQRRDAPAALPQEYLAYLLVFVPGYAYEMDPTTGADFARQRRLLERAGFDTILIETDELGKVEPNAKIVAEEILRLSGRDRPIVLVSASKGGAEVALALGRELTPRETEPVRAWVSIGGLLRGSPSADWAWRWPRSWIVSLMFHFEGLKPKVIPNLRTSVRRPIFERLVLPDHVLMVQYIGAPLSGHIEDYVRDRYEVISRLGPNDGLTLLLDEVIDGGGVITDIGLDHFYKDPEIDLKTFALTIVVLEELRRRSSVD